jgi:hypothetical protein
VDEYDEDDEEEIKIQRRQALEEKRDIVIKELKYHTDLQKEVKDVVYELNKIDDKNGNMIAIPTQLELINALYNTPPNDISPSQSSSSSSSSSSSQLLHPLTSSIIRSSPSKNLKCPKNISQTYSLIFESKNSLAIPQKTSSSSGFH